MKDPDSLIYGVRVFLLHLSITLHVHKKAIYGRTIRSITAG